jgi:methionine salvage enolase-phosphatase E1
MDFDDKNHTATEFLKMVMLEYYNRNFDNFTEHTDSQIDLAVWLISDVLRHFRDDNSDKEEMLADIASWVREKIN